MKICVDCKFFDKANFSETKYHACRHPDCRHPVSGRAQTCIEMRKRGAPCATDGSKFEELAK